MLPASLINNVDAYSVIFTVLLLSASLWYYIVVVKPFAEFPSWRLDFLFTYCLLIGRKLNTEVIKSGIEKARQYQTEGVIVAWLFKPRVVVFGEDAVKCLMPHIADKPSPFKIFEFSFGKAIFVSNGERWKRQKKILAPAFHTKALKTYMSFMNGNAKALVKKLSEKEGEVIVDISHILSESTLRLFYESSLGIGDENSKEVEKSIRAIHTIVEFLIYRLLRPWLHFDFMLKLLPYARQIVKLDEENRKRNIQTLEKMKKTVTSRDQQKVIEDPLSMKPKSIGEIIIEDYLKVPTFSMEDLARELHLLTFAGFDTTAHELMWIFYALGLHPEIQDRVYDEIAALVGDDIQFTDVSDLTYLDCVIKESLRLYSPPFLLRLLKRDVQCGKYLIPKNTEIILFTFMLHRNPTIYPDPEKFDPDRFTDRNSNIKPWNYIPFAEGPRPCIGKNYAMLSMKIFLIHVLRKFKVISVDREEEPTFKLSFVLGAEKEPRMKFIPRHTVIKDMGNDDSS